jgi:hypothetical protein
MDETLQEILRLILDSYENGKAGSDVLAETLDKINEGAATYDDANKCAAELGDVLANAFEMITEDMLPDVGLDYNVALSLVNQPLTQGYTDIADITENIQSLLNKEAGIGINAIRPDIDTDRVEGIAKHVSESDNLDSMITFVKSASKNFIQHHVDESVKQNAEFQSNSGMSPKIIRKSTWNCCEWCSRLAGTYSYPDNVPSDVYRRHKNCNCTVEYYPNKGRSQNVHTKKWTDTSSDYEMETRQSIGKYLEKKKWITSKVEDVTEQYLQNSTPGVGDVYYPKGSKRILPKDVKTAQWILEKFGDDIELLESSNDYQNPDSKWRNTYWEYKDCSSDNSINQNLRYGINQIYAAQERNGLIGKPVGMVLDATNFNTDDSTIVNSVAKHLPRRQKGPVDVIIKKDDRIVGVLRYKDT